MVFGDTGDLALEWSLAAATLRLLDNHPPHPVKMQPMGRYALVFATMCLAAVGVADLRSDIIAIDKKVSAAIMRKDAKAFEMTLKPICTKDFKYVENGQTMGFKQMVEGMRMGMKQMGKVTMAEAKLVSLKEMGSMATAMMSHNMKAEMMGPDKKMHKMGFSGMSTHTFKKVGGHWMMSMMKWGKQSMTMDGKPFDPSKMGGGGG